MLFLGVRVAAQGSLIKKSELPKPTVNIAEPFSEAEGSDISRAGADSNNNRVCG